MPSGYSITDHLQAGALSNGIGQAIDTIPPHDTQIMSTCKQS